MDTTYAIQLTQLESLYLSDALSMFTQGPPDALPGQAAPYPNLLLKIGGAVLETQQRSAPVSLSLSPCELWVIREVAKSSVVVGNERVGLSLLTKVYEGIRALAAQSDVQSVVNAFGEVVDDEPGKGEYVAQLKQIGRNEGLESGVENHGDESNDTSEHKPDTTN